MIIIWTNQFFFLEWDVRVRLAFTQKGKEKLTVCQDFSGSWCCQFSFVAVCNPFFCSWTIEHNILGSAVEDGITLLLLLWYLSPLTRSGPLVCTMHFKTFIYLCRQQWSSDFCSVYRINNIWQCRWILNTMVLFLHVFWTYASGEYTPDTSNIKNTCSGNLKLENIYLCVAVPFFHIYSLLNQCVTYIL